MEGDHIAAIDEIAYNLGIRDEKPNQVLAKKLAEAHDTAGIQEMASHLRDKNISVASDCLKVLYEAGYIDPMLIAGYTDDFAQLLSSKRNRMVWGAMIALGTIAYAAPDKVWPHLALIKKHIDTGTVITHVWGVKALMGLAMSDKYYPVLIEDLLRQQDTCRPIDFAKRAEEMAPSIRESHRDRFVEILVKGKGRISPAAQKRVDRVLKKIGA